MDNASRSPTVLIGASDPDIFRAINPQSKSPLLLVCEHAGQAIPSKLGTLGLSPEQLDQHIAWDIGAADLCERIANTLGCTAILQNYSRLVVDCNRPPEAIDAIPEVSDGSVILGNCDISKMEKAERIRYIFAPFHKHISHNLDQSHIRFALSIHSFTPSLQGQIRPWEIGFLYRKDNESSESLAQSISSNSPSVRIGMNQPYRIDDESDWFVPHHCETREIPHSLIELRNDQLGTATNRELWAGRLCVAINNWMRES